MVKIAVAGASTGIGRHLVDAVIYSGKHQCVVLSRNESPEMSLLGVELIVVNYEDQRTVVSALYGVHTLISAFNHKAANLDVSLVDAAEAAGVKRFIPSSWAVHDIRAQVNRYHGKLEVDKKLEKCSLEWAAVDCGVFMNYYATPTAGIGYLRPLKFWVDVENCIAIDIPGTGNEPVTFIRCEDAAKQVITAIDLKQWPKKAIKMHGDCLSFNKLVDIAQNIRGKAFQVNYLPSEDLKRGYEDNAAGFVRQLDIAILQGKFDVQPNIEDLPKPMLMEEFLRKWWAKG
ncbi:hypothetical protein OIDMADRAFT_147692 [Oidiodendron maius Zn]|uniref:NmrA-like domain-containing protein n=1 Tax=Oidiodendron maius (strain Zn) TaxID=913774 RepID=A0A0C3D5H2_OIDMZ|nr:hypothetical protein OIDMADRAFT_147692 [Oidiodendron maius Zn]